MTTVTAATAAKRRRWWNDSDWNSDSNGNDNESVDGSDGSNRSIAATATTAADAKAAITTTTEYRRVTVDLFSNSMGMWCVSHCIQTCMRWKILVCNNWNDDSSKSPINKTKLLHFCSKFLCWSEYFSNSLTRKNFPKLVFKRYPWCENGYFLQRVVKIPKSQSQCFQNYRHCVFWCEPQWKIFFLAVANVTFLY